MLPKPLHSGQAPSGWLNEKSSGWGRARATSQRGERDSRLTESGPCATTSTTARPSLFLTHAHAVEPDLHGLAVEGGGGLTLGVRQVHHGLADLDASEAALQEGGHEGARVRVGLRGGREADHGAGGGGVA